MLTKSLLSVKAAPALAEKVIAEVADNIPKRAAKIEEAIIAAFSVDTDGRESFILEVPDQEEK